MFNLLLFQLLSFSVLLQVNLSHVLGLRPAVLRRVPGLGHDTLLRLLLLNAQLLPEFRALLHNFDVDRFLLARDMILVCLIDEIFFFLLLIAQNGDGADVLGLYQLDLGLERVVVGEVSELCLALISLGRDPVQVEVLSASNDELLAHVLQTLQLLVGEHRRAIVVALGR